MLLLDALDPVEHIAGMAVGGIHHQHVDTGGNQCVDPLVGLGAGAHGGAHPEPALLVLAGVGELFGLVDILDGNQAAQVEPVVDHQHLFDAVPVQQRLDLVGFRAFVNSDQPVFAGHDRGNPGIQVGLETDVAAGDNTHQFAVLEYGYAGNIVGLGQRQQVADGGVGVDTDGILDHAALVFLDGPDFQGLILHAHALVDDTDTALLGQGDGQAGLGHCVHCRRHQGDVQGNIPGEAGPQADVLGHHLRVTGQQQYIVKGECFVGDSRHSG